jgi:hypothetical protein
MCRRVSDENILRRIRGEDIARAAQQLPECTAQGPAKLEASIDVLDLGRVRITFARFVQERGKLRRRFWTAERATLIDAVERTRE